MVVNINSLKIGQILAKTSFFRKASTFNKLTYSKCGSPFSELKLVSEPSPQSIKPNEAHVKILYSPINPSDVYSVLGTYPMKRKFPVTPGFEGVVEIIKGNSFKPGERAVVADLDWGMWKQEGVIDEKVLVKVPAELPAEIAATLFVNPCTAYTMLQHVVPLKSGDVLIQNGANSVCGQVIIQLANLAGIKTVNVIRDRPSLAETVEMLKQLGADAVITDTQLRKGFSSLKLGLDRPKLGVECVGGEAAGNMATSLANGGTLLVYGLLGGEAARIPQGDLVFRDITIKGFWMVKWIKESKPEELEKTFSELSKYYISGQLKKPNFATYPLSKWKDAITHATRGKTNEKVLLKCN